MNFWGTVIACFISTAANSAWQAPLTLQEKNAAESAALNHQSTSATTRRSSISNPDHPLGVQTLLIEPQEQKKTSPGSQKIAEVFTFNHHTHSAERTLVDLPSNTVISTEQIHGVHLPLSDAEIDFSIEAVRNDTQVQTKIFEEHASIGHRNTPDVLEGLQLRVSIWVPTTPAHAGNSQCDQERCALISLFDADNLSYVTEPVVNLKTQQIFLDVIR